MNDLTQEELAVIKQMRMMKISPVDKNIKDPVRGKVLKYMKTYKSNTDPKGVDLLPKNASLPPIELIVCEDWIWARRKPEYLRIARKHRASMSVENVVFMVLCKDMRNYAYIEGKTLHRLCTPEAMVQPKGGDAYWDISRKHFVFKVLLK